MRAQMMRSPDNNTYASTSLDTDRTYDNWVRGSGKESTFHQAHLKVHYKAITKAITDKRAYKMTEWR